MLIYTHRFLFSLIFTVVVETIVLWFLLRKIFKFSKDRISLSNIIFAGIFTNFATIPYVWFVFPFLFYWPANLSLILSELFAFIIEAVFYLFYFKIDYKKVLLISLICNLMSFGLGYLLSLLTLNRF